MRYPFDESTVCEYRLTRLWSRNFDKRWLTSNLCVVVWYVSMRKLVIDLCFRYLSHNSLHNCYTNFKATTTSIVISSILHIGNLEMLLFSSFLCFLKFFVFLLQLRRTCRYLSHEEKKSLSKISNTTSELQPLYYWR